MDKSLIGQPLEAIDTPALLVDYTVLWDNIARVQAQTHEAGLQLRPHIKAHKTPEIAHLQLRAGAAGVTAAKISEAEVMAAAGVEDIFIANCLVGEMKMRRLVALARRVPRLSVAVESEIAAQQLQQAFSDAGMTLEVVIEIDAGARRCGVVPEQVVPFARRLAAFSALRLTGVMAYAAGAYACRSEDERVAFTREEGATLAAVAAQLADAGFPIHRISGGCTPTAGRYAPGCGLTEIRCGTYCLNDHNQVDLGACARGQVAATVLATVISRPAPDRVITDAGTKALDQQVSPLTEGYGWVVEPLEANVVKINDEHGYLDASAAALQIGRRVRIIPPRICTCLNLYDTMYVIKDGVVLDIWRIAARGCNT